MVLELPNSEYVKQLKDMLLHWQDLNEAKQSLESINLDYSDVVNRALIQNAIVVFYKCFGKNEFRHYSLKEDKILANHPVEAKKVFYFYKNLRNKFIVHDESRLSEVHTGVILQSNQEYPFVDILDVVKIGEMFKNAQQLEGLRSFYHLIIVAIQWVEREIGKLENSLKEQYKEKKLSDFQELNPLCFSVPAQDEMYKK